MLTWSHGFWTACRHTNGDVVMQCIQLEHNHNQ